MLAGEIIQAPAAPAWEAREDTDQTVTATSPTNGSPLCGLSFVAPRSGMVLLQAGADMQHSTIILLGWRVRTGSTIGSGTLVDGTEPTDGTHGGGANRVIVDNARGTAAGTFALVSGLTPGVTYNAATYHYVVGGSGVVLSRSLLIFPLL